MEPPENLARLNSLVSNLREQHVFRIAAAYAVAAWLVIQVIDTIGPAFDLPAWMLRAAILFAAIGFVLIVGMSALLAKGRAGIGQRTGTRIFIAAVIVAGAGAAVLLAWHAVVRSNQTQIAVLPFADLSPQRDKTYLAEGVSEQILSALGKVEDLKVVGRTTAAALKDRAADPAELRSGFGITHLLEGSVRSDGPDLRLSVRLIRTDNGTEEWSEDFEGTADDVFGFQDRVAKVVAARLAIGRPEATGEAALTTSDAYNLYLAARQIARSRTEPELKRAYTLAQRLVKAKPNYAPGLSLAAELTYMLSDAPNSYGSIPEQRARALGVRLAHRAVTLAPEESHGYAALGLILDGQQSLDMLDRAIERDPSRSELYLWKALQYDDQGRYGDAIAALRKGVQIDPLWVGVTNRLAVDLSGAGRKGEASAVVDQFERLGGPKAAVARMRTNIAHLSGDLSEVVRLGATSLREDPTTPYIPRYVAKSMAFMGLPPDPAIVKLVDDRMPRLMWTQGIDAVARDAAAGTDAWSTPSNAYYFFALGARRDWPQLVRLYDRRSEKALFCNVNGSLGPIFVPALRAVGRSAEAEQLQRCLENGFARIKAGGPRYFEIVDGAQVAALSGNRERAFQLLERAVATGWSGLSTHLTDYPGLDGLMRDPRYARVQGLLDAWIARERRELGPQLPA